MLLFPGGSSANHTNSIILFKVWRRPRVDEKLSFPGSRQFNHNNYTILLRAPKVPGGQGTQPLNDGSRESGLYKIAFELNKRPSYKWIDLFIQSFIRPTEFTSMHRPGIASAQTYNMRFNKSWFRRT